MDRPDNIQPGLPLLALARQLVALPVRTVTVAGGSPTVVCSPDSNRVSILVLWPNLSSPVSIRPDGADLSIGIAGEQLTGYTLIHTSVYPVLTQQQWVVGSAALPVFQVIETVYRPTN